ncbi:hypothetical protein BpHYR1_015161 [Brachionus plicatilis]|uniref:Uncharacterized protein n=1 Tax=Brachionus plicatilis TaxID=10195 RepID=A0A3M7Q574_BRAPC|nr:hypothetical protein BpHYR1_015161 [Brachionus plicatilis]
MQQFCLTIFWINVENKSIVFIQVDLEPKTLQNNLIFYKLKKTITRSADFVYFSSGFQNFFERFTGHFNPLTIGNKLKAIKIYLDLKQIELHGKLEFIYDCFEGRLQT